ncbi:hypothetical protein ACFL03_05450 [Thermodesulfobacteriota bacterium]
MSICRVWRTVTGFVNDVNPDFSRRLLTPTGRIWDLVLTDKGVKDSREEVLEIEQIFGKWKVVRK